MFQACCDTSAATTAAADTLAMTASPARLLALIAVVALGVVGIALVTQHGFGMQPCPWCVLQRLIFVTIAAVALVGLAWSSSRGALAVALGVGLLAASGAAAALWQHFVAASSTSCNLTLADKIVAATGLDGTLPEVFAPQVTCADGAATLFSIPYEFYSLTTFLVILAGAAFLIVRHAAAGGETAR
jgi:disulfide bond formation protein DsbB